MAKKILGLDISENSITAVQVKCLLKGYQVTAYATVRVEGDGGLDDAIKRLSDEMDLKSDSYVSSIPAGSISCQNLEMPFKDKKKLNQTLPFEIESLVPFSIEDLIVDFTVNELSEQNEIVAVSARKVIISEQLNTLNANGIDPDVLDIRCVPIVYWLLNQEGTPDDGLFFEIGEKNSTMVLYVKRRIILIRTFRSDGVLLSDPISNGKYRKNTDAKMPEQTKSYLRSLCIFIRNTIHAFAWRRNMLIHPEELFFTGIGAYYPETKDILNQFFDIPAKQIDLSMDNRIRMDENISQGWNPLLMDSALALALREAKKGKGFNFRKNEFEKEKHYLGLKTELRKATVFLIVILLFLAVDTGIDYHFIEKRYRALNQEITEVFRRSFPDVKKIVDPLSQMKVNINDIKKSTVSLPGLDTNRTVLDLLKDISERVPESLDIHVERMVIAPDTVRISGRTDTFNTIDNIKTGLSSSSYFTAVTISSANLDRTGKQIRFEIKLQKAK